MSRLSTSPWMAPTAPIAPRHFTAMPAADTSPVSAASLPGQRRARIAARRAFVELKQRFIDAVAGIDGSRGRWLRHQVRQSEAPVDLWLLRGAVFDALRAADPDPTTRHALHQALDSSFPAMAFPGH
ncbi:hypothetical protein [Aquabacterium humicola]|uniref:hypothetical protein n=1 Tax=Aquabacterium humicola TaxID=3237377 RepID=UPI0025433BF0|nr:hypothetical protein [Rubrivivax pictus]